MVGADPHGPAQLLHLKNQRGELLLDTLQFLLIIRVGVFDDL